MLKNRILENIRNIKILEIKKIVEMLEKNWKRNKKVDWYFSTILRPNMSF